MQPRYGPKSFFLVCNGRNLKKLYLAKYIMYFDFFNELSTLWHEVVNYFFMMSVQVREHSKALLISKYLGGKENVNKHLQIFILQVNPLTYLVSSFAVYFLIIVIFSNNLFLLYSGGPSRWFLNGFFSFSVFPQDFLSGLIGFFKILRAFSGLLGFP